MFLQVFLRANNRMNRWKEVWTDSAIPLHVPSKDRHIKIAQVSFGNLH